ncbi:hypothetical protein JCM10213_006388 [Rhodosporidiobolus nylandii]
MKRTSVTFNSPGPSRALRARKRQKTSTPSTARIPRSLNSDGEDQDAGYETESDYEDQEEHRRSSRSSSASLKRRRSAPAAGSRSTSTRRASLPQRQSLGGAAGGPSRPRGAARRASKEDDPAQQAVTQQSSASALPRRRAAAAKTPLSPVNHNVPRPARDVKGKGKERAVDSEEPTAVPQKRARSASSARVTRRASGGHGAGSSVAPESSGSRRSLRRATRSPVEDEDEAMGGQLEEDEAMQEIEEVEEEEADERDEDDEATPRARRGRRISREEASDAGEAADAEPVEEEWEDDTTPEQEDMEDDASADVEAKLRSWSPIQLSRLKVAELTELYLVAAPPHSAPPTLKDQLVRAIIAARSAPPSDSSLSSVSEADDDSPHPRTSREGSPEPSRRRSSGGGVKAVRKKVPGNRRSGVRPGEFPTPPPSDDGENDGEDEGEATETEDASAQPPQRGLTRRLSEIEMPPPPLPARRAHVRTRSSAANALTDVAEASPARAPPPVNAKQKPRAHFGAAVEDELSVRATGRPMFTSPVAHRTRGGSSHSHADQATSTGPLASSSTSASTSASATTSSHRSFFAEPPPPSRLGQRKAKQKAVTRLHAETEKDAKGKARALDTDEEDAEMAYEDEDGALVLSDGSGSEDDDADQLEGDSSIEIIDPKEYAGQQQRRRASGPAAGRKGSAAKGIVGRRRSARTAKQVDTPPSDADEESGGDGADEHDELALASDVEISEETTTSHLRRAGDGAKGRKVVRLKDAQPMEEDEVMEDDIEDEGEDDDSYEVVEEDETDDETAIDLAHATSKTLLRYKKDELLRLCEEHDVSNDGAATKKQLVDALLQWRDKDFDRPSSGASSASSTLSNASTQTARNETKTQALDAVEHASARTNGEKTPLLMRPDHLASPEKPRTPEHSKEQERQEDVNALDLESLQLQDKEIQPEKLQKLERVGSGGFKDVYKGVYRKRTIAICDIRGHLTDMDIKELGLLRDLRHKNIVQFIGVSVPKQPSPVPVMIITELCANGDLFDYLRKAPPPPFPQMLDIALGISRGIEYLHTRKPTIIHRDIKSSNVLITGEGVAKIADFGLARIKTSTKSMIRSLVGTVNWQAPELWHPHPRYNEKVDVYSVGLVFWEILQWHQAVKRYPFEGQNEHAIYHDVGAKQIRPPTGPLRRQWGGEIVDLITTMWDQDPAQRPSMTQVVTELEQQQIAARAAPKADARRR